ncbi:MAG: tetratricopeptide repeat protein [Bacteroidia bacterium]
MKRSFFLSLAIFSASLAANSQSLPVIIQNGNAKLAAMNYAAAEVDFANAIKVNDPVTTEYLNKLKKYGTMNEYQRSTSDMPDGFVYNHDYAVPYFGHGMSLAGLGRQDEALADFEKAITIDPKYAEALRERGMILIAKGSKDKGCMDLRKAKVLKDEKAKELYESNACSGMSTTFVTSGDSKMEAKDYAGAIADYTAAIQLNGDSIQPYMKRAECHVAMKKYDLAVKDYNKALKINPDTVTILYQRGLAYNAASNYKLAFADFSCVIRQSPNHYDAYMQRAAACEGMENFRSATYDYGEAIRIRPKDGLAYYKRGVANQDAKDNSFCKDFQIAAALGLEEAKSAAENCAPQKKK